MTMAEDLVPVDDDFTYKLQDALAPLLREGVRRSRRNNQSLVAEKLVSVEKAIVKGEATEEAAEIKAKEATKATASTNGTNRAGANHL
jgi:hypothetical protein